MKNACSLGPVSGRTKSTQILHEFSILRKLLLENPATGKQPSLKMHDTSTPCATGRVLLIGTFEGTGRKIAIMSNVKHMSIK